MPFDSLIHEHPLVTVIVFSALVLAIFLLVLFQADQDRPRGPEEIQQGDWDWPMP